MELGAASLPPHPQALYLLPGGQHKDRCLLSSQTQIMPPWAHLSLALGYVSCTGWSLRVALFCFLLSPSYLGEHSQPSQLRSPSDGSLTTSGEVASVSVLGEGLSPDVCKTLGEPLGITPSSWNYRSRSLINIYKSNSKLNFAFRRKSSQWHSFEIPSDLC